MKRCCTGVCVLLAAMMIWVCDGVAATSFVIAPYVQNITADSVTIMWETNTAIVGQVSYGVEGALNNSVEESAPAKNHKIRITGLQPDTEYTYQAASGMAAQNSTVKTAPGGSRPITFVIMGDTRRWENTWEETQMAKHVAQWAPEFFVNNGDLVLNGHKQELWTQHFNRFADILKSKWMAPVRGNHEGTSTADTENDWFTRYHDLPNPGSPYHFFDWGNTHFILLDTEPDNAAAEWLDKHMGSIHAPYTIVFSHYPVYCCGYRHPNEARVENGSEHTAMRLVLEKYSIPLFCAGHTHIYERSRPLRNDQLDVNGVTYLTQGGDIGANYPAAWTAVIDNDKVFSKPTYTLVKCADDRIELHTFAWAPSKKQIMEMDYCVLHVKEAVPAALLASLPELKDDDLIKAIHELGAMQYQPAARELLPYLLNANTGLRRTAATALRSIADIFSAELLAAYLENPDLAVRREIARALEMAMPDSIADFVASKAMYPLQDKEVRINLLGALELHASYDTGWDTAIKLLWDCDDKEVRHRAAHMLSVVAGAGDVKAMTKLVAVEKDPYVLLSLGYALNKVTGENVNLDEKQAFATSQPDKSRKPFIKQWLTKHK